MIDIHSHLLPNVDDGSESLETSLDILKKQEAIGVTKVILTPHYKSSTNSYTQPELIEKFNKFKDVVKQNGINVELFLGQEVYCNSKIYSSIKDGEVLTINNTKYILVEFHYFNDTDIADYVYNLITLGYVPIIAHIERYTYLDWNTIFDLKQMGALIQVNAASIIGKNGRRVQKYLLDAMGRGLIDFVASDTHTKRQTELDKAYKKICKTLGKDIAELVLQENAENLLV